MTSNRSSLEKVALDFAQWRETKKSVRERTPPSLCLAAAGLMAHYSTKEILAHLKISFNALKAFQKQALGVCGEKKPVPELKPLSFVPFSLEASALEKNASCQVIRADGTQLIIQQADPVAIMKAFLCLP